MLHLTSVNVIIIIPGHKGKYKKEITELDFNTENRWASNFASIIKRTFIVKNKITDKT